MLARGTVREYVLMGITYAYVIQCEYAFLWPLVLANVRVVGTRAGCFVVRNGYPMKVD